MHITELRAENIKRLVAVRVKPDGSLVVVGGNNGQGKTSLLDSIAMALGGKDLMPAEPLRRGAEKGQITVTLDDGATIKRTLTSGGGGQLTVTNADGARYPTPQKLIDGLVGKLSFDPLSFSRMESKAQAATLRALVGLDDLKPCGHSGDEETGEHDADCMLCRAEAAMEHAEEVSRG